MAYINVSFISELSRVIMIRFSNISLKFSSRFCLLDFKERHTKTFLFPQRSRFLLTFLLFKLVSLRFLARIVDFLFLKAPNFFHKYPFSYYNLQSIFRLIHLFQKQERSSLSECFRLTKQNSSSLFALI